jgi:hypothetical protein
VATTCPTCGAASATDDYCDLCGASLTPASPPPVDPAPAPPAPAGTCPNCGAVRTTGDTFCESCGLDFATGEAPPPPPPVSVSTTGWSIVVDVDRTFFEMNDVDGVAFPDGQPTRRVPLDGDEIVIGRRSDSRGIVPEIDLSVAPADPAVSHRHAVLHHEPDGTWTVTDEGSTNGTWLNGADSPLPAGTPTSVGDGDRLNVGSYTRLTLVRDTGGAP